MNNLAIECQCETFSDGRSRADQRIIIDGLDIAPNITCDLSELTRSLSEEGSNFAIFTCGCGTPECAYIAQRVQVRHSQDKISWTLRLPVFYWSPGQSQLLNLDEQYDAWVRESSIAEYVFFRSQIAAELKETLAWLLNETPTNTTFAPYGTEREILQTLADTVP